MNPDFITGRGPFDEAFRKNTTRWTGGLSTVGTRPFWGLILVVPASLFADREYVRTALREFPGVTVIKAQMLPVDPHWDALKSVQYPEPKITHGALTGRGWKNTGRYRKD